MAEGALIVVDMLRDFIDPRGVLTCGEAGRAIVPAVEREIQRALAEGRDVYFVCDRHLEDDAEFRQFPRHAVEGTWGAQIIDELTVPAGARIVPKRRYSGFYASGLDLLLRERGTRALTVVGVCTQICVLYTTADARERGYGVTVNRNAVASFDEAAHRWALHELESTLGATLVDR